MSASVRRPSSSRVVRCLALLITVFVVVALVSGDDPAQAGGVDARVQSSALPLPTGTLPVD